ncbi:MAG: hypothetical protein HY438_00830 [DPANN group archaeon]|nr:hypothetical protein [DPANN group archaeon]
MKSKFRTSQTEIQHIIIALLALAFAFSLVLFRKEIFSGGFNYNFKFFTGTLIAVGFAFILHELGHKFVAEKYGLWAEFRMWPFGLVLAVGMALIFKGSFVFAAPGATMIAPIRETKNGFVVKHINITKEKMGKIGLAGPAVNNILTLIFVALSLAFGLEIFKTGAFVNAGLAIFNLLPFAILDGQKIWGWSKGVWLAEMLISASLFFLIAVQYV